MKKNPLYPSRLRSRAEFLRRTVSMEHGISRERWETTFTCWCCVEPLSGREFWEAAAINRENEVRFTIRYRKDAWQVVYGTLRGFDGSGFWLDAQRTIGPDPEAMVVGYLNGTPAGMIQLSPGRDAARGVGYIPFLYLREPFRHQGLGIQLIGHAVSFYRKRGRTKLQLSVAPTNAKALGFYRKYGFEI